MEPERMLKISSLIVLIFINVAFLLNPGVITGQTDDDPIEEISFDYQRLYKEDNLVYRSAFGDLIPGNDLDEMAVCSRNGRITVTYGSDMSWKTDLVEHVYVNGVSTDPAEVYSLAVGDIIPEREGDELVSVDSDNSVRIHMYEDEKWISEVIWEDTYWLYEVAVSEIIDGNDGPEIVVVGEDWNATLLTRTDEGWISETIFRDNLPLDCCAVSDILKEIPGPEIIVSGIDRNVTLISGSPGNWKHEDIAFTGSSVIDVVVTDLDPTIPGEEIYASTFNGEVFQIYQDGIDFSNRVIHDEGRMVYCLEKGSLEGKEVIAFASYNNRVGIIHFNDGFKVKELYREDFLMMGAGIHDLDPYHKGNELFALSGLGYVTMIYHDDPGLDIILPFDSTTISLDESLQIPFFIRSKGGYEGKIDLSYSTNDSTVLLPPPPETISSGMNSLTYPGSIDPGKYELEITVIGNTGSASRSIEINVVNDTRSVSLSVSNLNGTVGQDRQKVYNFEVLSNEDVRSPFILESQRIPNGISLDFNSSVVDPLGEPIYVSSVVKVRPSAELAIHEFFIVGSSSDNRRRAIALSILVQKSSVADFELFLDETGVLLDQGGERSFTISIISINGFSESINISLIEEPPELEIAFSRTESIPPAEIEMNVKVLKDEGPFFVFIRGTSGDLEKETTLRIDTSPPRKDLDMTLSESMLQLEKIEEGGLEGSVSLNITPRNGTIEIQSIEVEGIGEEYEIWLDPADLSRIPYSITMEITVRAPSNGTMESLALNFSGEGEFWIKKIPLSYPDPGEPEENDSGSAWIVISILILLFTIGAAFLIYSRLSNPLNRNEEVEFEHGVDDRSGRGGKASERSHRGNGSLSGLGSAKK
jgi:hypothetical protein